MSDHTRICVEKMPRKQQEKVHKAQKEGSTPAHLARLQAAFLKDNIWPIDSILKIAFLNQSGGKIQGKNEGSQNALQWTPIGALRQKGGDLDPLEEKLRDEEVDPQEAVKKVVTERIMPLVGLRIEFIDNPADANIRVSFNTNDGAWAYVGTDHLNHTDPNEATVNLGWLDVGTIIHEFGHVLGMIHEHQNPKGKTIDWDTQAVYTYMEQKQGWDKATVNTNVLDRYDINTINGSDFDAMSVMLYFFSSDLTKDDRGTKQNAKLSGVDVQWLNDMYKKNAPMTPEKFYPKVYGQSLTAAVAESEKESKAFKGTGGGMSLPKHTWTILGVILAIIIIGGLIWYFLKNKKKGRTGRRYGY